MEKYEYSAAESKEAKKIKEKYLDKQESKIDQLRKLDKFVETSSLIRALSVGFVSTLILGGGVSFCLVGKSNFMPLGIVIGLLGIALMISNPFTYKIDLKNQREKYKGKIISLADEIYKCL